ncbi:MAG: transglutaminase domain-containing protein, partial [Victivallales bacterium]|nr:transglutaminase domain-containing protein [Victivallales bacterium]
LDYFLFESKRGFCQHFAQALVFLARAAGLRSRLVTGYAPGNYNVLANYYEVFEYHAHAWTQIFIERYGWLTFDGTPPGALDLQNTPAILATTRNAFDKTWTPAVPEIAFQPQLGTIIFSRTNPAGWGQIGKAMAGGIPGIMSYLFSNKNNKYNINARNAAGSADNSDTENGSTASGLLALVQNALVVLENLQKWLFVHQHLLFVLVIVAMLGFFTRKALARRLRRWLRKASVRKALRHLQALPQDAISHRIEGSLALANRLLDYSHHERKPGHDAFEQAIVLQTTLPECQPDFQIIAQAALQNHFAPTVTPETAEEAVSAVTRLAITAIPQIDG